MLYGVLESAGYLVVSKQTES